MKNFFQKTFQPKKELKPVQNISKEKKVIKESFQKKSEPIKDKKDIKIKPKISQEIMNANLSVLGLHPTTQNLKEETNNKNKDEKLNLKNIKETKINKKNDKDDNNNIKKNKEYKEPYKPLAHYIIEKNLRFEENKSKDKDKKKTISLDKKNYNDLNTNEFNSDEEDELIKSKRKKINLELNKDKKKNKKLQEKSTLKKSIHSIIHGNDSDKEEKKEPKKEIKKSVSGNFVRLNLKKKYQEKKRFRPVKLRKIALNHSRELYKYQKKTIKNSTSNYMGKGNQGLEDMDTLIKEQNDVDKNDNNNLLNTLVDKLPVFSQSFIEETQKTPIKIEENKDNNNDKEDNNCIDNKEDNKDSHKENKEEKNKISKTPITNRLTTILKNSLRKKVSLDTELKFLSQEFKYLLSGQKEKINKLNEIKHQTLLTKKSLETINEENNSIQKINIEKEDIQMKDETQPTQPELPKEEIEQIENEILITVLKENFHMDNFTSDSQKQCIKSILNKLNTFYISSPGPQQNLVYEYCSLLFDGLTVVISPVLPNITQNITSLSPCLKAAAITSFTTPSQKKEIYSAIKSGILNILYINPERFVFEKIDELKTFNISLICLEEILHSLPDSNHFRPLYINIINKIKMLNEVNDHNKISTLLLSNYITKEDKEKISEMYDIKSENVIEEPIKIEPEMNICISKENSLKLNSLLKLLRTIPKNKNIFSVIFCNYKKTINEVTTFLNQNGISATSYHGGKDEIERQIIQSNFIKNKIKILVCTSNYSFCFIQNFIKYIIIYEIPFSIEQLLNEFNKKDISSNNKYVHIFLDDTNYLSQRRLIFSDILERKTILNFIDYLYNGDNTNNKNNNKKKRNYLTSIGEPPLIDLNNNSNSNNKKNDDINIVNKIKCLNFNSIEDIYNIKRNYALYFLLSLSNIKNPENDLYNVLEVLGIGPSEITLRFFKTDPKELSNSYPLLKTILSNCKERMGAYTFDVSNICNIANINNYNEIILFLYKLQELKEISYETKEDGIFIKIKQDIQSQNNLKIKLLTYFYNLNDSLIKSKLEKLNCVYILLRKFAVNNSSIFFNIENDISTQIKCLVYSGNYQDYKAEINKKIFSYFDLYKNNINIKKDVLYAGNETEKDILLPIVKLESQRDKINFVEGLKNLIKNFLQYDLSITSIDVLFVLIGFFQKGKGIKNYMSHQMWNKYSNYDFEQLFDIVDSELKNIKIEFINENNGNKLAGSKTLKTK